MHPTMSPAKVNMQHKDLLGFENDHKFNDIDANVIRKFYKLDSDICKSRSNRNCVSNPRCLKGLGQPLWLIKEKDEKLNEDANEFSLKREHFCGLRNLGATCYLNTFLQLWYHNVTLRTAFNKWRPNNSDQDVLQNPIMSLQLVFSLMHFSKRAKVDPGPFIKCLKLDESQEQDTHEFSSLFVSFIQNKLLFETDKSIHDTINRQYSLKIIYVIKCNQCNYKSERESDFYELLLRVKGFKTINECIAEYLKEESLEGSNKYDCRSCHSLQDAKRYIKLEKLPPVLNLQLLRFDSQNGRSKKVNSFITFPDKLDMTQFIQDDQEVKSNENHSYNLFAVLIHEGQTAHSGHYITFIKRENVWYKFNDEHVEKLKDFNLKIDSDDDFCDTEKDKKSDKSEKIEKGFHKSKNAYMLVYRHESEPDYELPSSYSECNIPEYLTKVIDEDNAKFTEEENEFISKKTIQRENELNHQNTVKEIYSNIEVQPSINDHEVIHKEWLTKLFEANVRENVPPIDNDKLLCIHKKLDMSSPFKCISKKSADLIYPTYEGGPRITIPLDFCLDCVKYKSTFNKVKDEIETDTKEISSLLKFKNFGEEEMYWVGKDSFKKWKQLRLNQIEKFYNGTENGEDEGKFNEDILCEHGDLCTDPSKKRLISQKVWAILFKHFPDAPTYLEGAPTCSSCMEIDKSNQLIRDKNHSIAITQRSSLEKLYNQESCLLWPDLLVDKFYFILPIKFFNSWRKFLVHPNTSASPANIDNSSILCESHKRFMFPPSQDSFVGFDKKYLILCEEEWNILKQFYECTNHIVALKLVDNYEVDPEFCQSCFTDYIEEEKRKRFIYSNENIYIHKVVCDDESGNSDNNEGSKKKAKVDDNSSNVSDSDPSQNFNSIGKNLDGPRRSSRRRRYKNELEIKVSSSDKLKDIKLKIMNHFHVATFDQTLLFEDKILYSTHNNSTLGELEITPGSVLTLRVDNKSNENAALNNSEMESLSISTEGGFKGTQLQL